MSFFSSTAMPLASIFSDLATHMQSAEFLLQARHPAHPTAFTRQRKLPLPALVALLLSGMRMSLQVELDVFFAHLQQQAQLVRHVSAQAFAQARAKLSLCAIPGLNDWLIQRAERDGLVSRWRGLRLVAADASTVRFGLRASHVQRAVLPDQILFGLFLPGAELMLAASRHGLRECGERQMLVQHLERHSNNDLLLLDRGYPARWLVSLLNRCGSIPRRLRRSSELATSGSWDAKRRIPRPLGRGSLFTASNRFACVLNNRAPVASPVCASSCAPGWPNRP